jgi:Ser/Thr protein kinase RdoA (MazF antagonist)
MSRTQITRLAEQSDHSSGRTNGRITAASRRIARVNWFRLGADRAKRPLTRMGASLRETAPAAAVDEDTILGRFRGRVRSGLEPCFHVVRPRCSLDDLTLKNALVHDGALSGVIDVDFACYGDPLLAIGATLASIAANVGERGIFMARS